MNEPTIPVNGFADGIDKLHTSSIKLQRSGGKLTESPLEKRLDIGQM